MSYLSDIKGEEKCFVHFIENYEDLIFILNIYIENLLEKNLEVNFSSILSNFEITKKENFWKAFQNFLEKNSNKNTFVNNQNLLENILNEPMLLKSNELSFFNKRILD